MKIMRKSISLLLVAAMLFQSVAPIMVYAEATPNESITEVPINEFETKGNIEVETHLALPLINHQKSNITFSITDEEDNTAEISLNDLLEDDYLEQQLNIGDQTIRTVATKRNYEGHLLGKDESLVYLNINLYSLNKGKYTIKLSGKHFVTYSVDVTLDDYSKRVNITNENGMFALGDLNSDNKINSTDSNIMLKAIEENDTSKDLNLDGKVDIADLNYITAITTSEVKKATIENTNAIISDKDIKVELATDSIKNGDISNIFTDEGSVTLKPTKEGEPITLALDFDEEKAIEMSEIRMSVGENAPTEMEIKVESINGEEFTLTDDDIIYLDEKDAQAFTDKAEDNAIVINLHKQIAVKKVTIKINKTTSEEKLADIAKVEFLNNVKVETTKPDNFGTPKNIKVDGSKSEQLTVRFDEEVNVTGYEIKITGPEKNGVTYQTSYNTFTIEDLKNYKEYKISVRSINGEWQSKWSDPVIGIPTASRKPPVVDMVVATPGYSSIDFSWKDMDDTKSYNIYYREANTEGFESIKDITGTKYSLKGLKAGVEYEAYISGNNELGEGTGSKIVKVRTLEATATIYPKYKLINDTLSDGKTSHINDVKYKTGASYLTNNDNNRTPSDKWSMVDDNHLSYWEINDWQINASANYNFDNPIFILDQKYKMDEFVITVPSGYPNAYKPGSYNEKSTEANDTKVYYWEDTNDLNSNSKKEVRGVLTQKKDKNNQPYYVLKLKDPIETAAVQFGITVVGTGRLIQIAEVKFYEYDSLVDDVAALFTDEMRLTLAEGVDQTTIDKLRLRADEEHNGELNPYRDIILEDLKYAEKILNDEDLADDVIKLNPNISNYYNGHLGFAMSINDYQPLGIAAKEGENIAVYVGGNGKINAQIVYTQYHAEANAWQTTSKNLVKGQNIFTVPKIGSSSDERGGSLYIRYTSTPDVNNPISVRVSGGTKIPVLDLSSSNDETSKKEKISKYITELEKYNSTLNQKYADANLTFDEKSSVLGSTEIVTKHGLWSVSSIAAEKALTESDKVTQLYESTEAFDEMMEMFYRQKGLSENSEETANRAPKARINIRYMQMFDGAFMYAGGYHIGIEYGSISGLFTAKKQTANKTGYFGWGISHEIGHQINQSALVHAEVTNNIYALLAQTSNDQDSSRLEDSKIYDKIYDKVTSHTLGKSQNVFVTLGMYWQLHLAYDYNEDVTSTNTFNDSNSIYARINKLTRTEKLSGYSKDDLLYIYASLAAKKDLLEFFTTWGLQPTKEAQNYIKEQSLEPETRKIAYLNDAARRYIINGGSAMSSDTKITSTMDTPNVDNSKKEVTLNFEVTKDEDKILGYEILRNGESVAFITNGNTYVDHIGSENNRAYTYQVIAYDYLLNKTEAKEYNEIKISYEGYIASKDTFSIESNFKQSNEIVDPEDDNFDYGKLSINNLIDGKTETSFNGIERVKSLTINGDKVDSTTNNTTPYVIINLNDKYAITGIEYQALVENGVLNSNTIKKYNIYVSEDKEHWTLTKTGEFTLDESNNYTDKIYFMKQGTTSENQLWTYNDISYVKIEAVGNTGGISGSEISVIAPPGDNIDIGMTEDNIPTIGILDKDYLYDAESNEIIKAGSVIIAGDYRGEPAFNILTISDANDIKKRYEGYELLFAEVNEDKSVYEVLKGTWMYILTQEQYEEMRANTNGIRANLYRVNNAYDNTDERLTSTSKKVTNLPAYEDLKQMSIKEN